MKVNIERVFPNLILLAAALQLSGCLGSNVQTARPPDTKSYVFKDGERVCMIGDSITFSGEYMEYIQTYYATRFPERRVNFYNAGISGDKATGLVERADMFLKYKPTYVTLMIGMNDVESGLYKPGTRLDDEIYQKREAADRRYYDAMPKLLKILQQNSEKLVVFTPSIYDETAVLERESWKGRQATLAKYSYYIRSVAPDFGAKVIDMNFFMLNLNAHMQSQNSKFSIVSEDRVHPRGAGAFAMAYKFLTETRAPKYVSAVSLNAALKIQDMQENCAVSNVEYSEAGISFNCTAKALPMPVVEAAGVGAQIVPFYDDLNTELLRVKNLELGDYELFIDGAKVGKYSSQAFALGLNLAQNTQTPQYKKALELAALVHEYRVAIKDYIFKIQHVEHHDIRKHADVGNSAAVKKFVEEKEAQLGKDDKLVKRLKKYLADKPQEAELFALAMKKREDIFSACKGAVVDRKYEIKKAE